MPVVWLLKLVEECLRALNYYLTKELSILQELQNSGLETMKSSHHLSVCLSYSINGTTGKKGSLLCTYVWRIFWFIDPRLTFSNFLFQVLWSWIGLTQTQVPILIRPSVLCCWELRCHPLLNSLLGVLGESSVALRRKETWRVCSESGHACGRQGRKRHLPFQAVYPCFPASSPRTQRYLGNK